jgi:hypothetical protein
MNLSRCIAANWRARGSTSGRHRHYTSPTKATPSCRRSASRSLTASLRSTSSINSPKVRPQRRLKSAPANVSYLLMKFSQARGRRKQSGKAAITPSPSDLIAGVPQNQYFYYFANTASWKSVWSGDQDANGGYFCTSDKPFYYLNDSSACTGKSFKLLDLNGADQYSFSLTEGTDPKAAALNCQSEIQNGRDAFAKCWMRNMATPPRAGS